MTFFLDSFIFSPPKIVFPRSRSLSAALQLEKKCAKLIKTIWEDIHVQYHADHHGEAQRKILFDRRGRVRKEIEGILSISNFGAAGASASRGSLPCRNFCRIGKGSRPDPFQNSERRLVLRADIGGKNNFQRSLCRKTSGNQDFRQKQCLLFDRLFFRYRPAC